MSKELDAVFTRAKERYERAEEYWHEDRLLALDDLRFRAGEQWPEEIKAKREAAKRPCLVLDKLNQYIRQIVNDGRQNRPAIKVHPVDSKADIVTAEIFQGMIRHIEDASMADACYDTALEGAASCGQGAFRVLSRYVGDQSFEQELLIQRFRNHLSVLPDPDIQAADSSDMRYCFVLEEMEKEAFEAKWPEGMPVDWQTSAMYGDWFGDKVRIAEYWEVRETLTTLHMMADGSIVEESRLEELRKAGVEVDSLILQTRKIPRREVWFGKMSGAGWLDEPKQWPGQWIPILLVWGNELDLAGKVSHSGIVRAGKDPQRLYNYSRTAFAERVALTPKAPWVAAEGQIEDYKREWETANTGDYSVLRYKPTSLNGTVVPPPQRTSASDVPTGFSADMQISEHDIQAAVGMYNASLGAPSNERSGKAILARQREGDVGTFHYHDNLNRAIRHCGRILVDLIPKFYDTKRIVRVMGYDGAVSEARLDPDQTQARISNGVQSVYNLGVGRYDVSVSAGPSYNTLRQESADAMGRLVENNPELTAIIGDIVFKNMDWPGAQELSERMRLMLPPQVQEAEAAKAAKNASPEVVQLVAQFKQVVAGKDQALQQALGIAKQLEEQVTALQLKLDNKQGELGIKDREINIKEFEAITDRLTALAQQDTQQLQLALDYSKGQSEVDGESKADAVPAPSVAEILQLITAMQQSQPQPITQITVERGGGVRKEIALQAPSGHVYTGTINEISAN